MWHHPDLARAVHLARSTHPVSRCRRERDGATPRPMAAAMLRPAAVR